MTIEIIRHMSQIADAIRENDRTKEAEADAKAEFFRSVEATRDAEDPETAARNAVRAFLRYAWARERAWKSERKTSHEIRQSSYSVNLENFLRGGLTSPQLPNARRTKFLVC